MKFGHVYESHTNTKMTKTLFIFTSCLLYACINESPGVIIQTQSDSIYDGEIFSAELYVHHNDAALPSFFIIRDLDTFCLPVDQIKRCGLFNAIGRGPGEKRYDGYVEYVDTEGINAKINYMIRFYVLPVK
jgi:hypothetical protein